MSPSSRYNYDDDDRNKKNVLTFFFVLFRFEGSDRVGWNGRGSPKMSDGRHMQPAGVRRCIIYIYYYCVGGGEVVVVVVKSSARVGL